MIECEDATQSRMHCREEEKGRHLSNAHHSIGTENWLQCHIYIMDIALRYHIHISVRLIRTFSIERCDTFCAITAFAVIATVVSIRCTILQLLLHLSLNVSCRKCHWG